MYIYNHISYESHSLHRSIPVPGAPVVVIAPSPALGLAVALVLAGLDRVGKATDGGTPIGGWFIRGNSH